jgi:hypothetical protein
MIQLPSTCSSEMGAGQGVTRVVGVEDAAPCDQGSVLSMGSIIVEDPAFSSTGYSLQPRHGGPPLPDVAGLPGGSIYLRGEGRGPPSALAELPGHLL